MDAAVTVTDSALSGLCTGVSFNPTATGTVTGTAFSDSVAGVATDTGGAVTVQGNTFSSMVEGIGLGTDASTTTATITGNTFAADNLAHVRQYPFSAGDPDDLDAVIPATPFAADVEVIDEAPGQHAIVNDGVTDGPVINLTQGTEHDTIQAGIDAANSGDELLAYGDFTEDPTIDLPLTLRGAGGTAVSGTITVVDPADGTTISNLAIDVVGQYGVEVQAGTTGAPVTLSDLVITGDDASVQRDVYGDLGSDAVLVVEDSTITGSTFTGSVDQHVGVYPAAGTYDLDAIVAANAFDGAVAAGDVPDLVIQGVGHPTGQAALHGTADGVDLTGFTLTGGLPITGEPAAVLLQADDLSVDGMTFTTGGFSGTLSRGITTAVSGTPGTRSGSVTGSTFTGLDIGMDLNPGADIDVDTSTFDGNGVGIANDSRRGSIVDNTFTGHGEAAIALTSEVPPAPSSGLTDITGNTFDASNGVHVREYECQGGSYDYPLATIRSANTFPGDAAIVTKARRRVARPT